MSQWQQEVRGEEKLLHSASLLSLGEMASRPDPWSALLFVLSVTVFSYPPFYSLSSDFSAQEHIAENKITIAFLLSCQTIPNKANWLIWVMKGPPLTHFFDDVTWRHGPPPRAELPRGASVSACRLTAGCGMKENASLRMKISYTSNKYLRAV